MLLSLSPLGNSDHAGISLLIWNGLETHYIKCRNPELSRWHVKLKQPFTMKLILQKADIYKNQKVFRNTTFFEQGIQTSSWGQTTVSASLVLVALKFFGRLFLKHLRNSSPNSIPTISDSDVLSTNTEKPLHWMTTFATTSNSQHLFPQLTLPCLHVITLPDSLSCTEDQVLNMILSLDPQVTSGPNGISSQMLPATAASSALSLTIYVWSVYQIW